MPQNSITPEEKAQAVNLGGMMTHVEAVMQRFNSEVVGLPAQTNVKNYVDNKTAIYYDPATKGMVFPADTSRVEYDPVTKGMIFH